ncbi:hypothetical protein BKG82_27110 [Mycobacteroides chelonae]|uniref:Uncharacterized protein n=1 Tax=Mycobacteroides chelonae TaxID=1774 RepID=A0A1S1LL47_MYCCH|nr:hypothetical protein BKG82_27110 [Mycobacteroides chelonae]
MVEAKVRPTAYAVSCLPPEHPNAFLFTLRVEWRSEDRWCVTDGAYCYRKDGHKAYESNPSSRTDRFKKAYRFPLDEALALAKRLAPKITINGHTVEAVLAGR